MLGSFLLVKNSCIALHVRHPISILKADIGNLCSKLIFNSTFLYFFLSECGGHTAHLLPCLASQPFPILNLTRKNLTNGINSQYISWYRWLVDFCSILFTSLCSGSTPLVLLGLILSLSIFHETCGWNLIGAYLPCISLEGLKDSKAEEGY